MGGRGTGGVRNASSSVEEKFEYKRSEDLKEWSAAEEKRTSEMSKSVTDKIRLGGWNEYYEENQVEDIETYEIDGKGVFRDNAVTVSKMNLVYASNWDENDRRVKRGKAVTGSTYYIVQTEDGSIREDKFAFKTKADAIHAAKLYVDEERQKVAYWEKRKK